MFFAKQQENAMNASIADPKVRLQAVLERQKAVHLRDGRPSIALRSDRLNRCINLLLDNNDAIAEALNADFGNRPKESTGFTDVAGSIGPLKHARSPEELEIGR